MIFIMRVFPKRKLSPCPHNPRHDLTKHIGYIQIIGWSMIGFLVVFAFSGELAVAFQCTPVQAGYDKSILATDPTAKCYSPDIMFGLTMYQGVFMFLCDFIILVLPMPSIWALQVPLRKRLLLASLFSFGISDPHLSRTYNSRLMTSNRHCRVHRGPSPLQHSRIHKR